MSLEAFLVVSAIIFSIGLYGTLSKRNAITVLMSLELMFNAVNITAVAMSRYVTPASLTTVLEQGPGASSTDIVNSVQFLLTGQIFAVFIITVAAAEVALGLAIVMTIFRSRQSVFVTDVNQMKR